MKFADVSIDWLYLLQAALIALAAVVLPFYLRRKPVWFPLLFITGVLVWPLFIGSFSPTQTVSNFYGQPTTYAGTILFGVWFTQFRNYRLISFFVAGILISAQLMFTVSMFNWYAERNDRLSLAEIQSLLQDWHQSDRNIVVLEGHTEENSRLRQEWDLIWSIYSHYVPLRVVYDVHAFPLSSETQILASVHDTHLIPVIFGDVEFVQTGRRSFDYVIVTPSMLPIPTFVPQNGANFANILRMHGITATQSSDNRSLDLWLIWKPIQPEAKQYQFSVRLVNEEGYQYSQVDGAALQNNLWRSGDTVVTQLTMPLNEAVLDAAMWRFHVIVYTWPELENQMLLDETGNIVGDIMVLTQAE